MSETKTIWHPYPQEKPKKDDQYLVSVKAGKESFTSTLYWITPKDVFEDFWDECITAWAEMPEPYKGGNNGQEDA